jgi:phage terminase large subunit GpA-like protein
MTAPASRPITSPASSPSSAEAFAFTFTEPERRVFRGREIDPVTGRPITVSTWAARYRHVTTGRMQGLWRNEITPYAAEPMNTLALPYVRKVFLQWPPQTSKTQISLSFIAYCADQDPGPLMYVSPDEKLSRRVSKRRIQPMFARSPRLAGLLSPRAEDNTLFMIRLLNGMDIMLPWASSAAELSAEEARYMIFEEVDKYADTIGRDGREGDVIAYGEMRQNTYPHTRKGLYISSPSAFPSRISALIASEADQIRRYYARCPFCAHPQIMTDDHLILARPSTDHRAITRDKLGRYSCDKCGLAWDDYSRDQAVRRGFWKADPAPDGTVILRPEAVAFLLAAWYSPEISLSTCIADKIRADQDPGRKLHYVTQRRAEEYKETLAAKTEEKVLAHRARGYDGAAPLPALPRLIVPAAAMALTLGVDMQKHGFWYVLRAWAENFDSWLIDHNQLTTWAALEQFLYHSVYRIEGTDQVMTIWRAAMDTGGGKTENVDLTRTEEAYLWLREQPPGVIYGIKGMSRPQARRIKPTGIDKLPHSSLPIPGGLQIYLVDSSRFKVLFHNRLDRDPAEIGQHVFLHADTGLDYAQQILAEELHRKPNGVTYWHKIRAANHWLDAEAYAAACVDPEFVPSFSTICRRIREQSIRPAPTPRPAPSPADRPDPRETLQRSRNLSRPTWIDKR